MPDHKNAITEAIEVLSHAAICVSTEDVRPIRLAHKKLKALVDAVPDYAEVFADTAYFDMFAVRYKDAPKKMEYVIHVRTYAEAEDIATYMNKARLYNEAIGGEDGT